MTPERQALLEVIDQAPGAPVAYGIDRRGPWAQVGEASARAKTPAEALRTALQKALGTT